MVLRVSTLLTQLDSRMGRQNGSLNKELTKNCLSAKSWRPTLKYTIEHKQYIIVIYFN